MMKATPILVVFDVRVFFRRVFGESPLAVIACMLTVDLPGLRIQRLVVMGLVDRLGEGRLRVECCIAFGRVEAGRLKQIRTRHARVVHEAFSGQVVIA